MAAMRRGGARSSSGQAAYLVLAAGAFRLLPGIKHYIGLQQALVGWHYGSALVRRGRREGGTRLADGGCLAPPVAEATQGPSAWRIGATETPILP